MSNTGPAAESGLPEDIVDRLINIRNFVECAFMAAGGLTHDETGALQQVLGHASDLLEELKDEICHPTRADGAEEREGEDNV
jgi:hypothetical protein